MLVRDLVADIQFLNRVVLIHEADKLTMYDGEYDIRTIDPRLLTMEVNTYITKIERGVLYLDIYV